MENRNNELTVMEKDIAMKEKGNVTHNQDTIMENDRSESSDTLVSHTVLDAPIMDRETDALLNYTSTTSTSLELRNEGNKFYCKKWGSSISINPRKFYKMDGILLEDGNSENYPGIINQKAREKQSLEEFRREQNRREKQKKPEECVLSDRKICEKIHYFYYDIKSDF